MAAVVSARLESGFHDGGPRRDCMLAHQYLLDALDRAEFGRFSVWPVDEPVGVAHVGANGTLVVAGDPAAGQPLAEHVEQTGWRVLIGDAPLGNAVVRAVTRGWFRRRPTAREQRFMVCEAVSDVDPLPGWRAADRRDVEAVTELACRLHVEDRMGPALSRAGRDAVRSRMRDSIAQGHTWVLDRAGEVVAKVDLSLYSRERGAQIAGVYVADGWRGRGVATRAVAAVTRQLLADGLPGVTLHVRSDNPSARAAYRRAGFEDRAAWVLALR